MQWTIISAILVNVYVYVPIYLGVRSSEIFHYSLCWPWIHWMRYPTLWELYLGNDFYWFMDLLACIWKCDDILMGLLPDMQNCALRIRRECRERFSRHWLQRKPLISGPDMHHGTCVTHVPWCRSGSLTSGGGENVPGIPGACATRNFAYLARGPCWRPPQFMSK